MKKLKNSSGSSYCKVFSTVIIDADELVMNCFWWNGSPTKGYNPYFRSGPLPDVFSI